MGEFTLKRGLEDIYIAKVLVDDNETGEGHGFIVDTPRKFIPAGEMTRTADNEKAEVWFDNSVFHTSGKEGATDVSITGAALRPATIAKINGKYIDSATGAVLDSGDYEPTYYSLGGKANNVDGTDEMFWFTKGTFAIPELQDKTKDDSTDTNGMSVTYSAVKTQHRFIVDGKQKTSKVITIDTQDTVVKSSQSWTAQVVTPDNFSTIVEKKTTVNTPESEPEEEGEE